MELDTKDINGFTHKKYHHELNLSSSSMADRSLEYMKLMSSRRSVRDFSDKHVPKEVIENIIKSAAGAPSGANKQPWTFCAISNQEIKHQIRLAAEAEEKLSYEKRMSDQWLEDLKPIGTDHNKPFLEVAPWLIVAFKKVYDLSGDGEKSTNYYVNESVGIACGFLITAIHNAGLVTLTHTPSPMNFLSDILGRPKNERAFILFPVGYPAEDAFVPNIEKKPFEEISKFYE